MHSQSIAFLQAIPLLELRAFNHRLDQARLFFPELIMFRRGLALNELKSAFLKLFERARKVESLFLCPCCDGALFPESRAVSLRQAGVEVCVIRYEAVSLLLSRFIGSCAQVEWYSHQLVAKLTYKL